MKDWWNKKLALRAFYLFLALTGTIVFGVLLFKINSIISVLKIVLSTLTPFFIGFAIAYLLNPAYMFFRNKMFRRIMPKAKESVRKALAILTLYIVAFAIITAIFYLVIPQLINSIIECVNNLVNNFDSYYKTVDSFITSITGENGMLNSIMQSCYNSLKKWLVGLNIEDLRAVSSAASSIISIIVNLFVGVVVSIYMLFNKEKFCAQIKKTGYALLSKKMMYRLQKMFGTSHQAFGEYIMGSLIDAAIVGVTFSVLCLIFRIPYAPMIGVVLGITNMIRFFGPYIGGIPCTLIVLVSDPWKAVILVIIMVVVQQIDGNFIGPKIIGQRTGLSAIWVVFAIVVGGAMFGFLGMIISVPVFSIIYLFFRNFVNDRLEAKKMSSNTADYLATADIDKKYADDDDD